ncbi:Kae1-associated kinase Bud32 [Nanoarchaeota archaeon NZ13-N]|nr:MAG: Kae1-associated kinase Bud32 [Nanoarchaeota archaeon NZ13-N]
MKLLFHGAEAKVYIIEPEREKENFYFYKLSSDFLSSVLNEKRRHDIIFSCNKKPLILKARYRKNYRNPKIDKEFRKYRTRIEVRILEKLKDKIKVPEVVYFNEDLGIIAMEYLNGNRLSDVLEKLDYKSILYRVGESVGKMHKEGIIHGDLTTSNIILVNEDLYFIDFGLSFFSNRIEDYATDLHLFKESLESRHWRISDSFNSFMEGYSKSFKEKTNEVLIRLSRIEKRGRYKSFI